MKVVDVLSIDEYLDNSNVHPLDTDTINVNDYKNLDNNEIPCKYVGKFFLAGDAIITVKNNETSNQFTFKVTKQQDKNNPEKFIWFVSVCRSYMEFSYIGLLVTREDSPNNSSIDFKISKRISNDPISIQSFEYILRHYINSLTPHKNLHFYHIGKCCKCGRELTDAQSIILGIGPYCRSIL